MKLMKHSWNTCLQVGAQLGRRTLHNFVSNCFPAFLPSSSSKRMHWHWTPNRQPTYTNFIELCSRFTFGVLQAGDTLSRLLKNVTPRTNPRPDSCIFFMWSRALFSVKLAQRHYLATNACELLWAIRSKPWGPRCYSDQNLSESSISNVGSNISSNMGSTIDIHSFGALRTVQNGSARFRAISPHFPPGSPLIYCCPDAHYSPIPPSTPKSPPLPAPLASPRCRIRTSARLQRRLTRWRRCKKSWDWSPGAAFAPRCLGTRLRLCSTKGSCWS